MTRKSHHFPVFVSAADVKGDGDVAGGAGAGDAVGAGLRGWLIMHWSKGGAPTASSKSAWAWLAAQSASSSVFFNWMTRCWACKSRVRSACPC